MSDYGSATHLFELNWANNDELYHAVIQSAEQLIHSLTNGEVRYSTVGDHAVTAIREMIENQPTSAGLTLAGAVAGRWDEIDTQEVGEHVVADLRGCNPSVLSGVSLVRDLPQCWAFLCANDEHDGDVHSDATGHTWTEARPDDLAPGDRVVARVYGMVGEGTE